MSNAIDIRVLELLASKICHDLISPIGAISNGIEVMEEIGGDSSEIVPLLSFSAAQANAKLKTLRLAYGLGGSDPSIKPTDVHKVFGEFISGENRISQDWDPYTDLSPNSKKGFAKVLISSLMLAAEALPKGGVLSVKQDDNGVVVITGEGENAHFRDGYLHALEHKTPSSKLDPKLVHAYITGILAKHYGFDITVEEAKNNFIFLRLKSTNVF